MPSTTMFMNSMIARIQIISFLRLVNRSIKSGANSCSMFAAEEIRLSVPMNASSAFSSRSRPV